MMALDENSNFPLIDTPSFTINHKDKSREWHYSIISYNEESNQVNETKSRALAHRL